MHVSPILEKWGLCVGCFGVDGWSIKVKDCSIRINHCSINVLLEQVTVL